MQVAWSKPSLSRDFALFAMLIVLALSLASLWVTYQTYQDHSGAILNQMETETTRIDRAMIVEIQHSSDLLEGMGRQISHMDVGDLKNIALLLRSFDTTATLHHVFSWIDDNQNNVVTSNKGVNPRPIDVSDRDFVKRSIAEPWKIQIGRPIHGRVSGLWALPIALGITDTTGKFLGTVLISMDLGTIKSNLHTIIRDTGFSFALYSQTLLPLTEAEDDGIRLDTYSEKLRTVDFAKHPSGVLSTISLFDAHSISVYYEVSADYPYIILLGFDAQASGTSMNALLLPRLIPLFLTAFFMLALLWVVRLRIIQPVSDLGEVTAGIIRGEPYQPPQHGGAGEVISLAQQLRKLSNYLGEIRRIEEEKENKNLMLRKGKEAAEFSNKIKIEFLTAMSHELRTPLNTIVGFSEIMENQLYGPLENTQYWQYTKDIHQAAQQLQALVDDVLALSNAEAGLLDLQEKPVDIRFILNKSLRLVSERMAEQKLHIEMKMPDVMPRLLVDELRLKQIIINLMLNAAAHSPEDGHIIVEAKLEKDKNAGEWFCISFTDFGAKTGAATNKPTKDNPRRKTDLSNLGIPLTKALVAMHQATLDIVSPPGKPTTITVRFPAERIVH